MILRAAIVSALLAGREPAAAAVEPVRLEVIRPAPAAVGALPALRLPDALVAPALTGAPAPVPEAAQDARQVFDAGLPKAAVPVDFSASDPAPPGLAQAAYRAVLDRAAGSLRQARPPRQRLDLLRRMRDGDEELGIVPDAATYAHGLRVGLLAGAIALEMGGSVAFARMLAWAARFHDVGKGDPAILALVNLPRALESSERLKVERHAALGAEILRVAGLDAALEPIALEVALRHHERWDGKGYPDALAATAVRLEARIVHAADILDALMEARPYRPRGRTVREALDMLKQPELNAGIDPEVYGALVALLAAPSPK